MQAFQKLQPGSTEPPDQSKGLGGTLVVDHPKLHVHNVVCACVKYT